MYTLVFAPQALEDLSKLKKAEPAAFKKAGKLLNYRNIPEHEPGSLSHSLATEPGNGPGGSPKSIEWSMK